MEGPRLGDITAAHPEIHVSLAAGVLYAWIPDGDPDGFTGETAHARTEEELAAKLAAKYGG